MFLAHIPLGLSVIILILWKLGEEWAEARGGSFDLVGSILYSLASGSLICGLSILPNRSGLPLLVIDILGLMVFILWETKTSSPI